MNTDLVCTAAPISGTATMPILLFMSVVGTLQQGLSPAQLHFAQDHRAIPGLRAGYNEDLVFLYRHDARVTRRWLVDPAGHVLDAAAFRNAAAA